MSAIVKYEENEDEWRRKVELWKRVYMKGATDDEMAMFENVCKRTGLSPEMKQIYPVSRWDGKLRKNVYTFQTSIDGFRLIADRTGRYSPGRKTTFIKDESGNVISATAYVKKRTDDGTWHEIEAEAFWDEYCQWTKEYEDDSGKKTPPKVAQFWQKMPHVMLGKCAEALALRRAFPAELSGLYTMDEMAQASKVTQSQEALDVEHAQALEMAQKTEGQLQDEWFEKFKDAPESPQLAIHLAFCLSKTKKSKREFLEGCIEDPDAYLKSYRAWLEKNFYKQDVEINL